MIHLTSWLSEWVPKAPAFGTLEQVCVFSPSTAGTETKSTEQGVS